jgi:hypothetical protein
MKLIGVLVAGLLVLTQAGTVFAQISNRVSDVSPTEALAGQPLTVTVDLLQASSVREAFLMVKTFGASEYRRLEMEIQGTQASATVPVRGVTSPFLEVYVVLELTSGGRESYPLSTGDDPFTSPPPQPLRIRVVSADEADTQILFLSPDPNAVISTDEAVISFSLLRADSNVVRTSTQLLLDGADVTAGAVVSDDIVVYVPENTGTTLSSGRHTAVVRIFDREGKLYRSARLSFSIRSAEELATAAYAAPPPRRGFDYDLQVNIESRHEEIRNEGTWYNRGGYRFRGTSGIWTVKSNAFATTDETPSRQPQNRFFLGVETPWVQVGYGDAYPAMAELILNGKRVRGLHSSLGYSMVHLDVVYGQTTRSIEGSLLKTFPVDSFSVEFQKDSLAAYGPVSGTTWGKFSYGTYSRNLFAFRPTFGDNRTWLVGISWLSSRDDTSSIQYGLRPQENIVLGADFLTRFDNSRIELTGEAAFSAFNADISSGTFTDEYIRRVYDPRDTSDIKRARDFFDKFITVNDNLRPLSPEDLSTAAYTLGFSLNYFDNLLKFSYLYRGSGYTSFGQTFLRRDIQGFSIVDRVRLLQDRLFGTIGYERLQDNVNNNKPSTTTYGRFNVAATYVPDRRYPSVTVGYNRDDNTNGLSLTGRDSLIAVDDVTDRLYLQTTYDFLYGARHTANLSVSYGNRSDRSLAQNDVRNASLELGLNTMYSIPLRTILGVGAYWNDFSTGRLNYTTLSLHGRYEIVRDIVTVLGTVGPTFGDYQRTVLDLGVEWYAMPRLVWNLQFSYFANETGPSDNFVSLRGRFSM